MGGRLGARRGDPLPRLLPRCRRGRVAALDEPAPAGCGRRWVRRRGRRRPRAADRRPAQSGPGSFVAELDLGSRIVQVPAQFLVGYQPPLQIAASVAAAMLALVAVGLLVRRGNESERRAAVIAAAIGAAALVAPAMLAFVGVDYVLTRYLTGAWIVVAAVAAVGFGARAAGRAGPLAATVLCAVFVAVDLGSAWEPKFDRDDWRGAAAALGPPDPHRAVVLSPRNRHGRVPLLPATSRRGPGGPACAARDRLGRPRAAVREIGRKPRPPRPVSVPAPAPGFRLADRQEAEHFTIVRFRAPSPDRSHCGIWRMRRSAAPGVCCSRARSGHRRRTTTIARRCCRSRSVSTTPPSPST